MRKNFSTGSFIIGVMVGSLLVVAWLFSGNFLPTPDSSSQLIGANGNMVSESSLISVANQPSGLEVVVESISVQSSVVWIAVREVNGNVLGNVLGAARIGGPRTNVSIQLLRATESSRPYVVELYRDDGSGEFNVSTNSVYIDFDTSAPVIAHFKTTE